jgi:hypothetical protein
MLARLLCKAPNILICKIRESSTIIAAEQAYSVALHQAERKTKAVGPKY